MIFTRNLLGMHFSRFSTYHPARDHNAQPVRAIRPQGPSLVVCRCAVDVQVEVTVSVSGKGDQLAQVCRHIPSITAVWCCD